MNQNTDPPNWQYRFAGYEKAFFRLREAIEIMEKRELSALEQAGTIRRFIITWELAWKTMKAYLAHEGVMLPVQTPIATIRAALAAGVINNREVWGDALEVRNKLSCACNFQGFAAVIADIQGRFFGLFERLYERLHSGADGAVTGGLNKRDLTRIARILRPYADRITRVCLFGSRATGKYREGSDIDLVLYGDLEPQVEDRLFTLFDESLLGLTTDVKIYNHIAHPPLKQRIDQEAKVLFTGEELRGYFNETAN